MPFGLPSAFAEYPAIDCCRSVPLAHGTERGSSTEFSSKTLLSAFDHYFIFFLSVFFWVSFVCLILKSINSFISCLFSISLDLKGHDRN